MTEYTNKEQEKIIAAFRDLNNSDVRYVICRGHQDLPQLVPGADIDFFVYHEDYDQAKKILRRRGFSTPAKTIWTNIRKYVKIALEKPKSAIKKLITDPTDLLRMLTDTSSGPDSLRGTYEEMKLQKSNIKLHFSNRLAYKSTLGGKSVRVNPTVEKEMIERRSQDGVFTTPSPPDELAHLICRGIFDKEGHFADYYINRCIDLSEIVHSDPALNDQFNELLQLIFFNADVLVQEAVAENNYSNLRQDLREYTGY